MKTTARPKPIPEATYGGNVVRCHPELGVQIQSGDSWITVETYGARVAVEVEPYSSLFIPH